MIISLLALHSVDVSVRKSDSVNSAQPQGPKDGFAFAGLESQLLQENEQLKFVQIHIQQVVSSK